MNVLIIIVRSDFGGGPRHVHQLVENLPEDINIFMAYPEEGDPYADLWKRNKRIKGTCFIPYRKLSISTLWKLIFFVKENNIDIVHSHGNGAGLYSRLLKVFCPSLKVVHTFHGITNNYTSLLKAVANKLSGRVLSMFTDSFILVGKGELELGAKLHILNRNKSRVIFNGIDTPSEHQVSIGDGLNIATLSRFDYQKNMDMAYEIASHFKNNSNVRFTWIGDGCDFARLKETAEKENLNIIFTGFSTEPMKHLSEANLYMSTSRFEGLPYALVEAASMSLPVIATNVVGNNECVEDGKTGYLFENVDEAVNIINGFLQNPSKIVEFSKNSRMFFLSNFTIDKMINELLNVYKLV